MTDTTPSPGAAGATPPQPLYFDPSFEPIPTAAAAGAEGSGPTLLLFDPRAGREWVADAAIALATEWTRSGRRAVLADLSLDDPVLHERIGMANQDGVVDIFLYGASLARSARPVPGRGFYLISAGTYTSDGADVLRHPRWEKIVAGFREANAALLLFVPADAEGVNALARWASETLLLGTPGSERLFRGVSEELPVRAWLAPPAADAEGTPPFATSRPADPAARFPEPEPAPAVQWQRVVDAPPRRAEPEFRSAEETVGAPPATLPAPDATWEEPPRRGAVDGVGGPRRLILLLVLLAVVGLAAAAYYLWESNPALFGRDAGASAGAAAPAGGSATGPAPLARAAALPAGAALPFAVSVRNYNDFEPARREMERVQARFPEAPFYVVPEETQGVLYYKVMVGLAGDTAQAAALRQRLLDAGVLSAEETEDEAWALIQPRPLAFDLGAAPTDAAAAARADSLMARGIPAYPVAVPYSDGGERWHLYAGAFRDSAAAEPLRRILETGSVRARLAPRTGRPPAVSK